MVVKILLVLAGLFIVSMIVAGAVCYIVASNIHFEISDEDLREEGQECV